TLQIPNANVSEEEDEAEELIVVPTALKHTAAKVGPRKSSTSSKAEEFVTELQNLKIQEKDVTPKTSHLNVVKRIFKYLKGKPNLGLWYPRESSFDLEAFSDSDYAGANLDRKSTTGGYRRTVSKHDGTDNDDNQGQPQEEPIESQPPPNASIPSTSQPTTEPHPDQELETKTELHGSSSDFVHIPPTQVEISSPEPTEHTFEQPSTKHQPLSPRQEPKAPQFQDPSHPHVPKARSLTVEDLLHMVPTLITKKVKKLENILKRRNVVLTTSEDEEPEDQGRIFKDIDDDPLVSFGKRYKRRKSSKEKTCEELVTEGVKEVILCLGFSTGSGPVSSGDRKFKSATEEIKSGFTSISSGEVRVSQRKGKEVLEEQPQPKRSKKQIREEEASLAEIARIQAQEAAKIERKSEPCKD
ncbi:hypothetical protein Tco_0331939, partial [Tanacetum coccineum]